MKFYKMIAAIVSVIVVAAAACRCRRATAARVDVAIAALSHVNVGDVSLPLQLTSNGLPSMTTYLSPPRRELLPSGDKKTSKQANEDAKNSNSLRNLN